MPMQSLVVEVWASSTKDTQLLPAACQVKESKLNQTGFSTYLQPFVHTCVEGNTRLSGGRTAGGGGVTRRTPGRTAGGGGVTPYSA